MTPGFYAEKGSNSQVASKSESQQVRPEDAMCTICFANDSNCIIMDCKHSGICKECSVDMLKKVAKCPFCMQVASADQPVDKICVVKSNEEGLIEVQEEIHKPSNKAKAPELP